MLLQPQKILASLLLFVSALLPGQAVAQDTLGNVLELIHIQETQHFSYLETRTLQLLAEPWQATGNMYTSPQQMVIAQQSLYTSPQQMVIAQQSPTPTLTIISAERMLHVNAKQNINSSLKLEQPFAMPGMEPFMLLLYGTTGLTELERDYLISLDSTGHRWSLQLTPRQRAEDGITRMQLSGDSNHGPDRLVLEHADGDQTEWELSLLSQGETADRELQQLLESIPSSP